MEFLYVLQVIPYRLNSIHEVLILIDAPIEAVFDQILHMSACPEHCIRMCANMTAETDETKPHDRRSGLNCRSRGFLQNLPDR